MSAPQTASLRWPKWLVGLLIIVAIPLALEVLFGFTTGDLYQLSKLAVCLVIGCTLYLAGRRLWPSFGRLKTAVALILVCYLLLVAACAWIYVFPNTPGEGDMSYYWSGGFPKPDLVDFLSALIVGLPWSFLWMLILPSGASDSTTYGFFWLGIALNLTLAVPGISPPQS